ncbi:PREDICTED: transmembrane protein 261 [Chrysochloris asiatica]|uniref:Transmembrane protein 261 n=1 Tax=Chrysochloris asiatica TaxID=185453 RepID=A0A9B0THE9_CHRAS|nr:PREDICTED: transmembrane protein 261 [Chrysochloris asiatica]
MGSFLSEPLDQRRITAPPDATAPASPASLSGPEVQGSLISNCWSCRVLSGSGLIGAGGYVYWTARKPMKLGYAPSPGVILQMVIGLSIASWGIVILADPKGKFNRAD